MPEPKLTAWERARLAGLIAKGVKRAAAGITDHPDIEQRIERLYDKARKRNNSK